MKLYSDLATKAVLPFSDFLLGTTVSKKLRLLSKSQYWSTDEIKEYQFKKLVLLIDHAYNNVPYYNLIYNEKGIKPSDITSLEDLRHLPIITKKEIKSNFKYFISKKVLSHSPLVSRTGGTTGIPMRYLSTKDSTSMLWATTFRGWQWAGYEFGDKRSTLAGTSLIPNDKVTIKQILRTSFERHLPLPSVHINEQIFTEHSKKLIRFKPRFIRGFPSILYEFSKFVKKNAISGIKPLAIFSTAEKLYPFQRQSLENVFSCQVFDNYSNPESGGNAYECKHHNGFHLGEEWAITEILNNEENKVQKGEEGNLIFTNLHNLAMPIIRYQSDDLGTLSNDTCKCGRTLPLLSSLDGRVSDNLRFFNGNTINGPMAIHIFRLFHQILDYQIVQNYDDCLEINIVKGSDYRHSHEEKIRDILSHHCGNGVRININYMKNIKRSKGGKKRMIVVNN
ncbi:MAG: hypothetical protein CME68_01805 [Halobacteriovoraceae bacterium]|nr:hypothetical protein [Halobacteriovoraceae bacterium]|tara:strand:- start:953 stop:2302 length:1350 start_codon:yes stop_codon:yes gene_type:complete